MANVVIAMYRLRPIQLTSDVVQITPANIHILCRDTRTLDKDITAAGTNVRVTQARNMNCGAVQH